MSFQYCIIPTSKVPTLCFIGLGEDSPDTLVLSDDGSKTFVKFPEGKPPECLAGETFLSHSEILAILDDPDGDWVEARGLDA